MDSGLPKVWGQDTLSEILLLTIHLLNWFTLTLAIISTIVVGIYYIGGFMNEGNVKKAKTLLTATYTGLAIVLLARLILEGPAFILTGSVPNFMIPAPK